MCVDVRDVVGDVRGGVRDGRGRHRVAAVGVLRGRGFGGGPGAGISGAGMTRTNWGIRARREIDAFARDSFGYWRGSRASNR